MVNFKQLRRIWLGLNTLFGSHSHGYFIPATASKYNSRFAGPHCYQNWEAKISATEIIQRRWLDITSEYGNDLRKIDGSGPDKATWNQDWFPRLDAAMLYCLVRHFRPKRIIEIGAGHSSRFIARAIADEGTETTHIAIDPVSRKEVSKLPNVSWIAKTVQLVGSEIWAKLAACDIISIDSSHVFMPGSDVDYLINEVFPYLPIGVIVQVHDIFLPDDYPVDWHWRGYNEQCAISSFLTTSGSELMFSSHFVLHYLTAFFLMAEVSKLPIPPGARESSVWFRIRSKA